MPRLVFENDQAKHLGRYANLACRTSEHFFGPLQYLQFCLLLGLLQAVPCFAKESVAAITPASHKMSKMLKEGARVIRQAQGLGIVQFDAAVTWLQGFLTRPLQGRFIEYRQKLSQVLRRTLENRIGSLASELSQTEFLNSFYEAEALIQVWKAFHSHDSPRLAEKLRIIIAGVAFAENENRKTQARDAFFELILAAYFAESGIKIEFGNPTDLSANFDGLKLLIECKRLQRPNAISGNIELAERQLVKALSKNIKEPARGIIALDASKIHHLSFTGQTLYPRPKVGNDLLPSSFLVADTDLGLVRLMRSRFLAFAGSHRVFWTRQFHPGVIGLIMFFTAPAVSRERNYGLFHCKFPCFESLRGIPASDVTLISRLQGSAS